MKIKNLARNRAALKPKTRQAGSVEAPRHVARHLLRLARLQIRTRSVRVAAGCDDAEGVITEWVPLPFVHMEAPIFRRGRAREGPTCREAMLLHAVGRLALHPWIKNIQASWPKLGPEGAAAALAAGANDLGGVLMNESISRAVCCSPPSPPLFGITFFYFNLPPEIPKSICLPFQHS